MQSSQVKNLSSPTKNPYGIAIFLGFVYLLLWISAVYKQHVIVLVGSISVYSKVNSAHKYTSLHPRMYVQVGRCKILQPENAAVILASQKQTVFKNQ